MAKKPEIQYIGQFYVYGSEAKKLEPADKQVKKSGFSRPARQPDQVRTICVDPVALIGLVVAVVMLVSLAIGAMRIKTTWEELNHVSAYLAQVNQKNSELDHTYRTGYDLAEIEATALAIGMIPATEAKTIAVHVTIPEPEPEPTVWEDIRWFLAGLFA